MPPTKDKELKSVEVCNKHNLDAFMDCPLCALSSANKEIEELKEVITDLRRLATFDEDKDLEKAMIKVKLSEYQKVYIGSCFERINFKHRIQLQKIEEKKQEKIKVDDLYKLDWIKILKNAIESRKSSWVPICNKPYSPCEWRNASDELNSSVINAIRSYFNIPHPLIIAKQKLKKHLKQKYKEGK